MRTVCWQHTACGYRGDLAELWTESIANITTPGATLASTSPTCYLRDQLGEVTEIDEDTARIAISTIATGLCAFDSFCTSMPRLFATRCVRACMRCVFAALPLCCLQIQSGHRLDCK